MLLQDLDAVFADDGPLAASVDHYFLRQQQLELAQSIQRALDTPSTLVAEAGTGTGKTWAYLVPVFLSGRKALISTGTRTLQDQLFKRDLPHLRKALSLSLNVALLKGRGNYVCHYYFEKYEQDARGFGSKHEVQQLKHIQQFIERSKSGDKSELAAVPEDAPIWHRVTSTRENCLGQDCPYVGECFVLKARRKAQEADIVVVNHALFMADLALREDGITDLLPEVDVVVFDEAHQLPDVATRFLGTTVSMHQINDLAHLIEAAGLAHAKGSADWSAVAGALKQAMQDLRLQAAPIQQLSGQKATFMDLPNALAFDEALAQLLDKLDKIIKLLDLLKEHHPDLAAAYKTALQLRAQIFVWSQPDRQGKHAVLPDADVATLQQLEQESVRWVEHGASYFRLHRAPLSVAQIFSRYKADEQSWIFTSATLSVHGNFNHFVHQLGLWEAQVEVWPSPFNYAEQAVLYVPQGLPLPSSPDFYPAFINTLMPFIQQAEGGVLVLSTTLRGVDIMADLIQANVDRLGLKQHVMRQGEKSRQVLLESFRTQPHAVLVGSASFWEGIDVPGNALTVVAIDKLPFAPPDDPVLEARIKACRDRGGNPFVEYQLPEAAIALKQGAGRLIRTEKDWGVLIMGDARLVEKPYGKVLWRGLPGFARTRSASQALAFYQHKKSTLPASRVEWD